VLLGGVFVGVLETSPGGNGQWTPIQAEPHAEQRGFLRGNLCRIITLPAAKFEFCPVLGVLLGDAVEGVAMEWC